MFGALWALAPFISCIAEGAITPKAVSECGAIIAACLIYIFMLYWVVFFLMGVRLVVVIRGLVFIFYCVD
jgi:hypothetical protein